MDVPVLDSDEILDLKDYYSKTMAITRTSRSWLRD